MDVSVVLPVRNAADTLRGAVVSVLNTEAVHVSCPGASAMRSLDIEVLVLDDGSTDGSAELGAELARRDTRVRALRSGGSGLVSALNVGLAEARGRYLARMDADDVSLPGRLRRQAAFLDRHDDVTVVGKQVELAGEVGDGMRAYVGWQNGLLTPDDHVQGWAEPRDFTCIA